jgi:hypothetical protein
MTEYKSLSRNRTSGSSSIPNRLNASALIFSISPPARNRPQQCDPGTRLRRLTSSGGAQSLRPSVACTIHSRIGCQFPLVIVILLVITGIIRQACAPRFYTRNKFENV